MIRWFQSRHERELQAALEYAEATIKRQEAKITVLQSEKDALRSTMLHWRATAHQLERGTD